MAKAQRRSEPVTLLYRTPWYPGTHRRTHKGSSPKLWWCHSLQRKHEGRCMPSFLVPCALFLKCQMWVTLIKAVLVTHTDKMTSHHTCSIMWLPLLICLWALVIFMTSRLASSLLVRSVPEDTKRRTPTGEAQEVFQRETSMHCSKCIITDTCMMHI